MGLHDQSALASTGAKETSVTHSLAPAQRGYMNQAARADCHTNAILSLTVLSGEPTKDKQALEKSFHLQVEPIAKDGTFKRNILVSE